MTFSPAAGALSAPRPPRPPPAAAAAASDTGQGWHASPRSSTPRGQASSTGRQGPARGSPRGKDTGPVGAPL